MKIINKKIKLTDLLDKQMYKKDIIYLLKILSEEDLFIPFSNNHLIELYTSDNKIYIPLFTSMIYSGYFFCLTVRNPPRLFSYHLPFRVYCQ